MRDYKERALLVLNKMIEVILMALLTAFLTAFILMTYLKPYLENMVPENQQFRMVPQSNEKVKI